MPQMLNRGKEWIRIGENGKILEYSINNGLTWFLRSRATSITGDFLDLMENGNELLAQTSQGLFYSTNNGFTWLFRSR